MSCASCGEESSLSLDTQGKNEAGGFFEDTVSLLLQAAGDFGLGGIIRQAIFLQLDDLEPAVGTQALLVLGDALPHPILLHFADGNNLYFQHSTSSSSTEHWIGADPRCRPTVTLPLRWSVFTVSP